MNSKHKSIIDYHDRWIMLAAVPAINMLNYYLTYSSIKWGSFLVITFFIDTLQGYCAWLAARWVVLKCDKTWPWEENLTKRLLIQTPLVCMVVLTVIILLTEVINTIAGDKPIPVNFYTEDIFIFLIWAIFVNFLYLALYFLRRYQEVTQKELEKKETSALLIKTRFTQKRIPFGMFSVFFVYNELVYGLMDNGKIPLPGYTLDRLEKLLDDTTFFRANRQTIVTRPIVDLVRKEVNGKLALFLKADLENPIMISRLRAPAFKKWIDG